MLKKYSVPELFVFELRSEERVAAKLCVATPNSYLIDGPDTSQALCIIFGTKKLKDHIPCRFANISDFPVPEEAPVFS